MNGRTSLRHRIGSTMGPCTLALGLSLALALGACVPDGGGAASDAAPDTEPAPSERDIPLTEVVRTEDEKDLRLIHALRAFIPALMRNYGSPGFNIALARRGDVVWEAGFGYADLAEGKPMTPETVFQSGSMGKLYTGMAILKLVEEGVLELDGSINDYLPFEVRNPLGGRDITVRDLLTHRPGLTQDAALSLFERPRSLREEIEAEYGRPMVPMMGGDSMPRWHAKAGEAFMYSNLGMGTLGLIVEENNPEGLSYSEFVEKHFMEPLGMSYSQYPPVQDREHIRPDIFERKSTGYMPMGSVWIPTPAVYFGEFPAGGFVATPGDFVRFFLAFLNGGEYGGARILAAETVELALTPQSESMGGMQMGLAWMLGNVGEPVYNIQHGGAHMYGWQNSGIAWPNFDTAVVYATNNWAVPEIAPDVAMLRSFIEHWLLVDAAVPEVAERRSGADWARKVSYVRGVLFTAAFNYAIAIPTPVSDEQIQRAADAAILNPDRAATQDNWDSEAFVQGARDLREHGTDTAAVSTFLTDNAVVSGDEFRQAYLEIGGNPEMSTFFSALFVARGDGDEERPLWSSWFPEEAEAE
ncbi:MAG: beta-lactamase family protein [Gammaproteobacteria bacterium]|nr:beta-lactamase family protein [Gammaproteobacteria bacterium]MYE80542.1 beta-lactamase family protein [Gammaproteobacteria bacterium]